MSVPKTLPEEYCVECDACVAEFNDPNIDVFMKVGSFYEMYMVDTPAKRGGDLATVAAITNLQISRKNTKIDTPADFRNPYFIGFPVIKEHRYVQMLIAEQRTVVLYDQVPSAGMNNRLMRIRKGVYTSSTWIEGGASRHTACHCVLEQFAHMKTDCYAGLCFIDVVEGTVEIYEENGEDADVTDRLTACFLAQRPNEVVFHVTPSMAASKTKGLQNVLVAKYGLWYVNRVHVHVHDRDVAVPAINEIMRRVWPERGDLLITPIESFGLHLLTGGLQALVLALEQLRAYHQSNVHQLEEPILRSCNERNKLALHGDVLLQMCVLRPDGKSKTANKSIYDLLDCCRTRVGKRRLEYVLSHPSADCREITQRHEKIQEFVDNTELNDKIRDVLHGIGDAQVYLRKWCRGTLNAVDMVMLHNWVSKMVIAVRLCEVEEDADVQEFSDTIKKNFVTENVCGFNEIRIKGCDEELDGCWDGLMRGFTRMQDFVKRFRLKNKLDINSVRLEHVDEEGYILKTAKKMGRDKLFGVDAIAAKTGWVLHCSEISVICKDMNALRDVVLEKNKKAYSDFVKDAYVRYGAGLKRLFTRVAELDMVTAHACVCRDLGLTRPAIVESAVSSVRCTGLKNMIVAHVSETVCIPVDVTLGSEHAGIIVHGLNSSGKSTLIKSVGAAVILAQAGLFVPCREMILAPFDKMVTQVEFQDDINRGHSSFCVEMQGLDAMFRGMGDRSLIMADELTRGTEQISSVAIFCSAVKCMQESGARFLMSTHLTELERHFIDLDVDMNRLRICHFTHGTDKHGQSVFTRELTDGRGPTMYGVQVAEHIVKSAPTFIQYANRICENLSREPKLTRTRRSRYNSSKVMMMCEVCGGECTETHHIRPQKDADASLLSDDGNKVHALHNLVALCRKCHESVHHGNLIIEGYVQGLCGKKLLFHSTP